MFPVGRSSPATIQGWLTLRAEGSEDRSAVFRPETKLFHLEQSVDPEGVSDSEYVSGCVAIEADRRVKIDLLCGCDPQAAASVEKMAGAAGEGKLANVFCEDERAFAELSLDHESRLI